MIRPSDPRPRIVHEVRCPGCGRRIRAGSLDERRARVLRHVRNCNALAGKDAPIVSADDIRAPATADTGRAK